MTVTFTPSCSKTTGTTLSSPTADIETMRHDQLHGGTGTATRFSTPSERKRGVVGPVLVAEGLTTLTELFQAPCSHADEDSCQRAVEPRYPESSPVGTCSYRR